MAPSEFWAMSPEEWWLIHETTRPRDKANDYAGTLTDEDCDDLAAMLE